jgi:hypothetical protein
MKQKKINYHDPDIEEEWCMERRAQVIEYLNREKVIHGEVGEWPAWHVAPYTSIWAIESKKNPGWVGWWVICGDVPADYVSAASIKHPREALKAFGESWRRQSILMTKGTGSPRTVGFPKESWVELAPLLKARAKILLEWAKDDSIWED